ncbi:hypothetical protein [Actinoplanes sp. NPDC051859]|uniref:hypothetical protein n=1 Tax=Actinoplanes sp. NPDC051859 TaxID=3363909 RepID=UPI0037B51E4F
MAACDPFQSVEAGWLSAALRGDEEEWRRLREIEDPEGGGWLEVLPVAMALAAVRRFGRHDLRLITVFVRRFLARETHLEWDAADVEAVLRGVLGEVPLLTSVASGRAIEIMHALLFALIDELGLDDEQADELLLAAERRIAADDAEVLPEGPPDPPVLDKVLHRRARRPYLTDDDATAVLSPDGANGSPGLLGRLFGRGRPAKRSRRDGRGTGDVRPSTVAGRFISATMLRHEEERLRLVKILHATRSDDVTRLTRAAFVAAVRHEFRPDAPLRTISDLPAGIQRDMHPELHLMHTEFAIRAVLGEEVPLPELSIFDEIGMKTLVLAALADWWDRDVSTVHSVIVEAEAQLAGSDRPLATSES